MNIGAGVEVIYVQERKRDVFVNHGEFIICAGFRLCGGSRK